MGKAVHDGRPIVIMGPGSETPDVRRLSRAPALGAPPSVLGSCLKTFRRHRTSPRLSWFPIRRPTRSAVSIPRPGQPPQPLGQALLRPRTSRRWRQLLALLVIASASPDTLAQTTVRLEFVEAPSPFPADVRRNIEAYLQLDDLACDAPESLVRARYRRSPTIMDRALRAIGYYGNTIRITTPYRIDACWSAPYRLQLGERIRMRDVTVRVQGAGEAALTQDWPLEPDDPLHHGDYEAIKRTLRQQARARGYFDGRFTHTRLAVYPEEGVADAEIHYATGPRYHFGEVRFSESAIGGQLLERFVPFQPGDPFSQDALLDLQQNLLDSGYFRTVTIDHARDTGTAPVDNATAAVLEPPPRLPIRVTLEDRRPRRYTLGAGFGTDTGPRGRLGFRHRRLNRSGHQFDSELRGSEIGADVTIRYSIPLEQPLDARFTALAGLEREQTQSVDRDSIRFGLTRSWKPTKRWLFTRYLFWEREDFRVGGATGESTVLRPGLEGTYRRADDRLNPTRGIRLHVDISAAADTLGSSLDLLRGHAELDTLNPLWPGARLRLGGEIGSIVTEELRRVPASLRFFAGGDQSVRGFAFEALGPTNATGEVIGGTQLLVGRVEVQQDLFGRWGIATFFDVGNAFSSLQDPLERSAGAGLRWRSPVGPIRLDFAAALSREGNPIRLHVFMGPEL